MAGDLAYPFEQLLRVVGISGFGQPTEADRREVRRRLEIYSTGKTDQSLDKTFGLLPRGPLSALQAWRYDRRARLIRQLAGLLDDRTLSRRQLALVVHRDLRDYQRTLWPSDKRRGGPHKQTPAACLRFAIVSSGLPLPDSEKTIRRIISEA